MHTQAALLKELEEQLVRSLQALADEEAVLREREVRFCGAHDSSCLSTQTRRLTNRNA